MECIHSFIDSLSFMHKTDSFNLILALDENPSQKVPKSRQTLKNYEIHSAFASSIHRHVVFEINIALTSELVRFNIPLNI